MEKEKSNFLLGITTSVAIISLIGFIVMSVAYVKKDGSDIADNTDTARDAAPTAQNNPPPTPPPTPPPAAKVDIAVTDSDHIRGDKNAPITIIEYSDFQCPFCQRFHDTMKQVMEAYPNDVRWVYKHFPLDSIHPYARGAAEASECAGDQDKFWEFTDILYANQSSIKPDYFSEVAKDLGLNTKTFDDCLSSGKYASLVTDQFNEGRQNGVTGTPGNFINGQIVKGAVPFSQMQTMIDSLK